MSKRQIKGYVHESWASENTPVTQHHQPLFHAIHPGGPGFIPATLIIPDAGDKPEPKVVREFDVFVNRVVAERGPGTGILHELSSKPERNVLVPARLQILAEPEPEHKPCPKCDGRSTLDIPLSSGKHQRACCSCGCRGPFADTIEQAWADFDSLPRRTR